MIISSPKTISECGFLFWHHPEGDGIPMNMFTVLFALARTAGWVAQWQEMIADPVQKIGRPRQRYVGSPPRDFVSIDKRK